MFVISLKPLCPKVCCFPADKEGKPIRVPVGTMLVQADEEGILLSANQEQVNDANGKPMQVLPDRCKVIMGPEDTPITDKNGK